MRQRRPATDWSAARGIAVLLVALAGPALPAPARPVAAVAPAHPVAPGGEEAVGPEADTADAMPARSAHAPGARDRVPPANGAAPPSRDAGSSPRAPADRSGTVRPGGPHLRC